MPQIGQKQVVARGRSLLDRIGCNKAIGTRARVHDHRLLQAGVHFLAHNAGHHIRTSACRKRRDDTHRLRRKRLRNRLPRNDGKAHGGTQAQKESFVHNVSE